MSKAKQQDNVVVEYADLTGLLPWITQLAFFLSLALVVARCAMMESLRDPTPVASGSGASPAGPGPATTLWLNLVCCLPAMLVVLRRAIDKTYYLHSSIAHLLMGLISVWAIASTAWASDKYAAFINSSTVFAAGAMLWSTTQLIRSWTRLRLVAGACFGVMLICTASALIYHFVDHPDLVRQWTQTKDEVLRARGWEPDSFAAKQFELKVINGEILTFFASPNTLAAMLVFTGIITAGLAIQRISSRDEHGWAGTILPTLIPVLFVISLTHSKTALVTPVLAAVLLFAIPRLRSWMLIHRRMIFGGAIAAFGLAIIAVVGHGIYRHGLPTDSLNFRWRFWTGSMGVFQERPILGTGWANFGWSYLAHRLPEASEEIKDPHNFIVRFFCELGIVGGVLALLLLFRGAWEATVPSVPPGPSGKIKAGKGLRESMGQILPIVALAILINLFATIDLTQNGYWVFLEFMKRLLWAGLLILALALATLKSSKESTLDDRPAPWVLYGILVALLIFLLHNLVDFSMFENGPLLLTALLIGAVLGVRNAMSFGSRERSKAAMVTASLAIIAWVVVAIVFAVPITQAESRAREADENVRQANPRLAAEKYKASFDELLIKNSDYAFKAAEQYALMPDNEGPFATMIAYAIASNPRDPQAYRYRAGYYLHRGDAMNRATQIDKDFKQTLALDPNNVQARVDYADFLKSSFESQEAARQYELALDYDNKLDATEPKRLSAEQKDEIQRKIREIRGE
jgi:hypothetical protein